MKTIGELKHYPSPRLRDFGDFSDNSCRRVDMREDANAENKIKGVPRKIGSCETTISKMLNSLGSNPEIRSTSTEVLIRCFELRFHMFGF
jgi:hypothetical protein